MYSKGKEITMGYTASLTFVDDNKIVHNQSCKVETVEDGARALYNMLLPLMLSWQDYGQYGIKVDASVVSEDEDFWNTYEFKLGM